MGQAKRRGTYEERVAQAEPRRLAALASAQAQLQTWWDAQPDQIKEKHARRKYRFLARVQRVFRVRGLTFPVDTTVGTM